MNNYFKGWWHEIRAPNNCNKLATCQLLLGPFRHPTTFYATCFSSPPSLICAVLFGGGCANGCVGHVGAGAPSPGHDLACLLWDFRV
jgi:hypothetical protein